MPLPGDELVPSPMVVTTHAVAINAAPQQVWPWLAHTGHGRAGFYYDSPFWDRSVDWYYRVLSREQTAKAPVGYQVVNEDEVVAAWQDPHVGDIIAGGPPGTAYYIMRHVEPNKALVTFTDTHLRYLLPARASRQPQTEHLRRDQRQLPPDGARTGNDAAHPQDAPDVRPGRSGRSPYRAF